MNTNGGRLIVFEGVDATGKTTLCNELVEFLLGDQKVVRYCHFPGMQHGTLGELVNRIHHSHSSEFRVPTINPCSLQLLHIAAHVDTIEAVIKPALREGEWVVLDRYWWSTFVYGLENGVNESQLRHMINVEIKAWGTIKPDIVFLVDSGHPLRDDVIDTLGWQRLRQTYKQLANEDELQKCVLLETDTEINSKDRAASKIKESITAI